MIHKIAPSGCICSLALYLQFIDLGRWEYWESMDLKINKQEGKYGEALEYLVVRKGVFHLIYLGFEQAVGQA